MAIIINPQIRMSGSMTALDKLDTALQKIKKTVKDLNDLLTQTAQLAGQAGSSMGGMGGGGRRGGGSGGGGSAGGGRRIPPVANPFQNYVNNRQRGAAFRNRYNQMYGQHSNPIMNAVMRSRIDSNGNMMPLIMDLVRVVPAALRGPLMAVVAAAKIGNDYLRNLRGVQVMGGSSGGAGVMRASSAIGDVSGLGRNLMSGFGPMYAAQAGVNPLGGPFGDNDYNKKVLKLLDLIAKQKTFNQARAIAEALGSPEAANFWLLSRHTQDQLTRSGRPEDDQNVRAQLEFTSQLKIAWDTLSHNVADVAGPFLKFGSMILSVGNDIQSIVDKTNPAKFVFREATSFLEGIDHLLHGEAWDTHKDSLDKNTDALDNLQRSINQGISGGGYRASNAPTKQMMTPGSPNGYAPYGVLP
jgi:hypothetical protein